ncbi:hypothetical protein NP233_g1127 [Leucocoprinus birnbaumii]|uniref:Alkyl hydroperoxide reductase subunit C/ Thiol specific antioxidant domain-containing protein n=1 Tax=Leucocoprinus birnbaumii TaxID=56174 RepID=A0AAD5W0L1_9AGAR|nr:hypothetical protein NP233_g1127 [Leucocoprinus birnbaumii]
MPRKPAASAGGDDAAPRRSGRIASQPKTEEVKPAPKPRATKKRTVDDANVADAGEGDDAPKGKAKKAKADTPAEGEGATEEAAAEEASDAVEALAPIDIGDSLPNYVLKNEKGEDIQVGDIAEEQGAVIFLVPKADTPGCTTQACGFRDQYSGFSEVNYAKELPYSLISDPKRVLISALGAGEGGKTKRSHFIFEKGGKLVDKKIPVKPADSPKLALEFIKGSSS